RAPGAARPRLPALPRIPRVHHTAAERLCPQEPLLRYMRVFEGFYRDGAARNWARPLPVRHRLSLHRFQPLLHRSARCRGRGEGNDLSRQYRTPVFPPALLDAALNFLRNNAPTFRRANGPPYHGSSTLPYWPIEDRSRTLRYRRDQERPVYRQ